MDLLPGQLKPQAEGDKLFRCHQFEKALERYNKVLSNDADDRKALVARSRTYSRLGDFTLALADVEKVLKGDKKNHEALFQKAETLYDSGRYELALVFYHRCLRLKPAVGSDKLITGIHKSQDAIYAALSMKPTTPKANLFKNDRQFMMTITKTEMSAVVGVKATQRRVKRLADDGLKYLEQKQINI